MLTVNLFGGEDVGKSTIAAHAFAELTWLGVECVLQALAHAYSRQPTVHIEVIPSPGPDTPHEAAEMCRGALNFLVLRRKDYPFPSAQMEEEDAHLEAILQSGQVEYKRLPGVRASVPYIVKRVCEQIGYGK